jgi:hypothetical protein
VGFEGALSTYEIGYFIATRPDPIKSDIVKHIHRAYKFTVTDLKTHADNAGRAIKPCAVGIA